MADEPDFSQPAGSATALRTEVASVARNPYLYPFLGILYSHDPTLRTRGGGWNWLIYEEAELDPRIKTALGKRRTQIAKAAEVAEMAALAEHAEEHANRVEREPITVVCSAKGWLRALKGHQEQSGEDKYREGDRARFWFYAQTTDQIMLLATDGRFFTLDGAKMPGGRGNGEAIRTFIDLPSDADLVAMFAHVPGRKLLVASTTGHGFVTNEDDAVAMTKNGKRVMNVKTGSEAAVCRFVDGDSIAVVGEHRKTRAASPPACDGRPPGTRPHSTR